MASRNNKSSILVLPYVEVPSARDWFVENVDYIGGQGTFVPMEDTGRTPLPTDKWWCSITARQADDLRMKTYFDGITKTHYDREEANNEPDDVFLREKGKPRELREVI